MSRLFIPNNSIVPPMPSYGHTSVYPAPYYPVQQVHTPAMHFQPIQRFYSPAPIVQPSYGGYPGPMPMTLGYNSSTYYGLSQPTTIIIPSSQRHRHSRSSHRHSRIRRLRF